MVISKTKRVYSLRNKFDLYYFVQKYDEHEYPFMCFAWARVAQATQIFNREPNRTQTFTIR